MAVRFRTDPRNTDREPSQLPTPGIRSAHQVVPEQQGVDRVDVRGACEGIVTPFDRVKCSNCGEDIQGMGVMGPGMEWGKTPAERKQDQRRARIVDMNKSTRPGEVTVADLKRKS